MMMWILKIIVSNPYMRWWHQTGGGKQVKERKVLGLRWKWGNVVYGICGCHIAWVGQKRWLNRWSEVQQLQFWAQAHAEFAGKMCAAIQLRARLQQWMHALIADICKTAGKVVCEHYFATWGAAARVRPTLSNKISIKLNFDIEEFQNSSTWMCWQLSLGHPRIGGWSENCEISDLQL